MAHACDYQSRPILTWDATEALLKQIKQAVSNRRKEGWTERAIKEYCLVAYKSMGATEKVYESVIKSIEDKPEGV